MLALRWSRRAMRTQAAMRIDTVAEMTERLAKMLVQSIKDRPGEKRAFYVAELKELAAIIKGVDNPNFCPTMDELFSAAFRFAKRNVQIVFKDNAWFAIDTPVCPCCKRAWPEGLNTTEKSSDVSQT